MPDHVDVDHRGEVALRGGGHAWDVVHATRRGALTSGVGWRSSAPNATNITGSGGRLLRHAARDLERDTDTGRVVVRARAVQRVVVPADEHVRRESRRSPAGGRRRSTTRRPAGAGTAGARACHPSLASCRRCSPPPALAFGSGHPVADLRRERAHVVHRARRHRRRSVACVGAGDGVGQRLRADASGSRSRRSPPGWQSEGQRRFGAARGDDR